MGSLCLLVCGLPCGLWLHVVGMWPPRHRAASIPPPLHRPGGSCQCQSWQPLSWRKEPWGPPAGCGLCSQPGTPRGDHSVRTEVATTSPEAPWGSPAPAPGHGGEGANGCVETPPKKKQKGKKKKLQKAAETKQEERAETAALPLQNPAAAPALGQRDREGKNPVPCSGMGGRSRWGLLGSPGFSSRLGVSPACPWGSHLIAVTQLSICTSPR